MRRLATVSTVLATALLLVGCAGSDTQRYFPPKKAVKVQAQEADLRVLFVRQSVRELVVLARVTNHGPTALTLAPTGPTPSWALTIDGRTLPLAEADRTYWSAWSGTTTRDQSPLKVSRDLAPAASVDIEVRWRLEPPVSDAKASWVLTASNWKRSDQLLAPVALAFPGPESGWVEPPERNPNRMLRPGQRGYTNTRPWQHQTPEDD